MKIFLDDFRRPGYCTQYMYRRIGNLISLYSEEWEVVTNFNEFVSVVIENINKITHVSFDHDLSEEHYLYDAFYNRYTEKTGYDCAEWMLTFYKKMDKSLPEVFVHSMNPVGRERIEKLFLNNKYDTTK